MNTTQITKPAVRNIISALPYYSNYQSTSIPLSRQHNSELSNQNLNDTNLIRRPNKSPTLVFTTNNDTTDDSTNHLSIVSSHSLQEQSSYHQTTPFITERSGNGSGNLRPSFNYLMSTPQRNNGGYLAANQHQLLTRKTSIDPYDDTNGEDKTKLCKTYSDPSKIRYYNPNQHSQISPQPTTYRLTSTPYSPRQNLSRSQPTDPNHLFDSNFIHESPIQKSYSDKEASVFYGKISF
jgi:hypothetical protein